MTNQEMFNKAVIGLRRQGWTRAGFVDSRGNFMCRYADGSGRRCAWGHVDISLHSGHSNSIWGLHFRSIGIAATLTCGQMNFAQDLQTAHDGGYTPLDMQVAFRGLGERYGLTWPEEPPTPTPSEMTHDTV